MGTPDRSGSEPEGLEESSSTGRVARVSIADAVERRERKNPNVAETLGVSSGGIRAGDLVRTMRRARGMTQRDLAARANLAQEQISRIERGEGRHGPAHSMVQRIADALDFELLLVDRKPHEDESDPPVIAAVAETGDDTDSLWEMSLASGDDPAATPFADAAPVHDQWSDPLDPATWRYLDPGDMTGVMESFRTGMTVEIQTLEPTWVPLERFKQSVFLSLRTATADVVALPVAQRVTSAAKAEQK
jgi:transcriptional regulator with XRE-family HTH domain